VRQALSPWALEGIVCQHLSVARFPDLHIREPPPGSWRGR